MREGEHLSDPVGIDEVIDRDPIRSIGLRLHRYSDPSGMQQPQATINPVDLEHHPMRSDRRGQVHLHALRQLRAVVTLGLANA